MVGKEFAITKVADEQQIVLGWANVSMTEDGIPIEDYQHDMIEPEELERAAYEYVLKFRDTGEGHNPKLRKKGKLVESVVFTKEKLEAMGIPEGTVPLGWWIGFKIEDKSTWDKVKKGEYTMFSIEGTGERDQIEKAMTFDEVFKFNPNHDELGRFTTGDSAVSFTYKPGASNAHDKAIEREKKRHAEEEKAQAKKKEPAKLTGSEKQISWASKIRDSRMSYIDREVKVLEDNKTGYSPKTNEERKRIYLQAKDYLNAEDDAGWWIDTRSRFGDYMDFLTYTDNVKRMNARDKVPFASLKGSQKEVSWAESIREKSIKTLDNYAKTASVDKRRDYERARDYLSSQDDAKWWIDKRKDIDVPSYVMRNFGDIYTTYTKCLKSLTFKEAYMQSISKGA